MIRENIGITVIYDMVEREKENMNYVLEDIIEIDLGLISTQMKYKSNNVTLVSLSILQRYSYILFQCTNLWCIEPSTLRL